MKRPAVFLDRDGTLIEDRGHLRDAEQVAFFPDTADSLRRLQERFLLFIVTNQNGIAKGLLRPEEVERVNDHVVRRLSDAGVAIREVYCCPHQRSDGCGCIKPKPHFLRVAERDHGVDLAASFVVGDHPADAELAANAGARAFYVLTGHGAKHRADLAVSCEVVAGIAQAADGIAAATAVEFLKSGGVVAFPTETVYGLGADAENESAVRRIFAIKGRPAGHPLIVHLADPRALTGWAADVPELAERLAERFWPGPLTLVLRRGPRVPPVVTGGQETVALRVPDHPLALAMLRAFGGGVAAPSANRFGSVSPTTARHVADDLGGDVDFTLDGGACSVGIESTIVDLSGESPAILRPGGVTREAIEAVAGRPIPAAGAEGVRAPGRLESHYAPRAQVVLVPPPGVAERARLLAAAGKRVVVLGGEAPAGVIHLPLPAAAGDVARGLYAALREADARGADVVLVSPPPEDGVGLAVADRLRKAAGPRAR